MATFDNNITINISLDAPASIFTGFGSTLFVSSDSTLDGDRVRTYTTLAGAQADNVATHLSATALAAVTSAFSQRRKPASVKVGRKDGAESFAEAIAAILLVDSSWYTIAIDDRGTVASLESASGAIESLQKQAIMGSNDASWLTATPDAGFATLRTRERTSLIWHDLATANADVALCADRLSFDPDTISVPWDTSIVGETPYATALTDTEAGFAKTNKINLMQAYGPAPLFIDPGKNILGRPIYELLTRDWFAIRLQERMAALKVSLSQRGQKLVLDDAAGAVSAQSYALSVVNALYDEGLAGNHFVADVNAGFRAEPISSTDLGLERIRITGAARFAVGARLFDYDLNFTREAL